MHPLVPLIDTHAHFWSVARFEYPWIEEGSPFARDFLLEAYQEATAGIPVERMVFVECDCHPRHSADEASWVRELSLLDPRIQGIVAHAELTDTAQVDHVLAILSSNPLVKGIRHNIQGQPPGFCLQASFVEGVRKAWEKGFHFELCITHGQMPDAMQLVRLCPEVTFMLDHCGKPGIRAGIMEPWASHMQEMGQMANVSCKISGLLTEADWDAWTSAQLLAYMEVARQAFGIERILFGSDWPVNTVAGGYRKWYELTLAFSHDWSDKERAAFYKGNAERFYRL